MAKSWLAGVLILDSQGQGVAGRPAKNINVNPDGTWVVNPAVGVKTTQTRVSSITVHPSAASWAVVLSDAHGNTVFTQQGADARGDTYKGTWNFDGVVATTFTNVTRVILSTKSIEW